MAQTFADTLIQRIPFFNSGQATPIGETNKSVSIHLDKVEFPNVKSAEEIEQAIFNLPNIALQKSKEKL